MSHEKKSPPLSLENLKELATQERESLTTVEKRLVDLFSVGELDMQDMRLSEEQYEQQQYIEDEVAEIQEQFQDQMAARAQEQKRITQLLQEATHYDSDERLDTSSEFGKLVPLITRIQKHADELLFMAQFPLQPTYTENDLLTLLGYFNTYGVESKYTDLSELYLPFSEQQFSQQKWRKITHALVPGRKEKLETTVSESLQKLREVMQKYMLDAVTKCTTAIEQFCSTVGSEDREESFVANSKELRYLSEYLEDTDRKMASSTLPEFVEEGFDAMRRMGTKHFVRLMRWLLVWTSFFLVVEKLCGRWWMK